MKIIGFKVDGFSCLKAFELKLAEKGLIPFVGKNKAGKTAILRFVYWMFLGNKSLNPDIINWDKEKMEGELYFGDYKIERVHTGKSDRFKVKNTTTDKPEKGEVQNFLNIFMILSEAYAPKLILKNQKII